MLFADLAFARRLEGADARGNAQCAQSHDRLYPDVGAIAVPVAGGYAMYGGAASPVTQAMGLGMSGPVAAAETERMEEFYRDRGAAVHVELCPLADPSLPARCAERDYPLEEYSNVLARPLHPHELDAPLHIEVAVRMPLPDEAERWARTVAAGVSGEDDVPPSLLALFLTLFHIPTTTCFLASLDEQPAGGGAVGIDRGVASLFAASTPPVFRNRGVQAALPRARLAFAVTAECDVAMVSTLPGSASQRNAERQGFQVMYTRSKMRRTWP